VIEYRKGILRINEAWFDEPLQTAGADVLRCVQRSEPTPHGTSTPFHTLVIDLREEPDRLMAKMKKETRYEIRRAAEKDHLECQMWKTRTDAACRQQFREFYNRFAVDRGLSPLNHRKLTKFADKGMLILSQARGENGEPLAWHSYYRSNGRARLLQSAVTLADSDPSNRALIGRANRYLHCQDMSMFRADGVHFYDFGGWYAGKDDPKKIAINQFKEGFGGELVVNYNCLCGLTRIGNVTVWLYSKLSSAQN
jgi:hypothetical protein